MAGRTTRIRFMLAAVLPLAAAALGCSETEVLRPDRVPAALNVAPQVRTGTLAKPSLGPGVESSPLSAMSNGLETGDLTVHTAEDLANALVGAGVDISNVKYTGAVRAAGRFSGGEGIIGFDSGIILSTGNIALVVGPNEAAGITAVNNTAGDAALTQLAGFSTFDAAILEFDFVPDANRVFFQYVFASDEYNEYVGSSFNDVFAFWVNGVNCAVVGDHKDPVSINTINAGPNAIGDAASNPELYINNDPFSGGLATADLLNTEMDGLTVLLTCEADVNPGVTNTMRLAIADGTDMNYDSNVLIKTGSLSTTPPVDGDDDPPGPLAVAIDINGGKAFNSGGGGALPVAIFSTATFDAAGEVDVESLTFGRTGEENSLNRKGKQGDPDCRAQDVDGDGVVDLLCRFAVSAAGFQAGDTEGVLRGQTLGGLAFEGMGPVVVRR